jgi:hypothetical protein
MSIIILLILNLTYNIDGAEFESTTISYDIGAKVVYIKFDEIFKNGFDTGEGE